MGPKARSKPAARNPVESAMPVASVESKIAGMKHTSLDGVLMMVITSSSMSSMYSVTTVYNFRLISWYLKHHWHHQPHLLLQTHVFDYLEHVFRLHN